MNTQRLEDGHSDYLTMLSPPDFESLSSPHGYVNDPQFTPTEQPEGYLCMKPANIFSPRDTADAVFTFDVANRQKKVSTDSEETGNAELMPMLHRGPEDVSRSFANPSYHVLPNGAVDAKNNILKNADNYVNMPKNKCVVKCENILKNGEKENPVSTHYENVNIDNEWNHAQQQTCL